MATYELRRTVDSSGTPINSNDGRGLLLGTFSTRAEARAAAVEDCESHEGIGPGCYTIEEAEHDKTNA